MSALILFSSCLLGPAAAEEGSAQPAAAAKEASGLVVEHTPEEREQGLKQVTQDLSSRLKLQPKDIQQFNARLQSLSPEARDRMVDYLIEVRKRKLELSDGKLSDLDKMRVNGELRELYDGMAEEDEGFTDFLHQAITDAKERLQYSESLAKKQPDNPRYMGQWGRDLLDTGDAQGALEAARRATELKPDSAEPYAVEARAKLELGDYAGAYADARRALELEPRNMAYQSLVKLTESRQGGSGSEAVLAARPSAAAPADSAVFAAGSAPAADARALERARPSGGPIPEADFQRSSRYAKEAELLLRGRRFEDAVRATDAAVQLNPRNVAALYYRAWARAGMKDWSAARLDAEEALKLAPENARLLSLYSGILAHQRDFAGALQAADRAIRADPNLAEAFFHKSLALAGFGRREEALLSLAEAARLNPQYQGYYKKALELPQASDLVLLLSGDAPAQAASERDAPRQKPGDRFLFLGLAGLIGGFLVALGLLHALTGEGGRRLRSMATALTRRGSRARASESVQTPSFLSGVYRLRRKIGVGGMGVVYEAVDQRLQRKVAIKKMREEIRSDPREAARFLQEARMVAALHHPNIVEIYAIVEEGLDLYLVFEHVDGRTVHELLGERKRLPLPEALRVLHGCCAALDYAHRKGVIHRDLKPSNVMLDREGIVKVMDFGVARQAKDSLTRLSVTNTVVGTPPYMAPEQEQGAVCKESDVFALAVMLYEMATGQLPFSGAGAGMLLGKMNKAYAPASRLAEGLPRGFDEALGEALEPDPAKRVRSAAEFYRRIAGLA